jgi:hypothetical protein
MSITKHQVREKFEAWFVVEYEFYIRMGRRGYKLDRDVEGEYLWDIPKHDFKVFYEAFRAFGVV